MTRIRTSGAIAILFCVGVFLCSIGHVSGLETDQVYGAPDLMLTQGQAKYDLSDGIAYNGDEYELSVRDEGGFDINVPGNYTVGYELTPLSGAVRGSRPEETLAPGETAGPKETTVPKAPEGSKETPAEAGGTKETTAPKGTTGAKETTAPKDTAGAKETTVPKDTTGAKETTAPKDTTGAKETTGPKATTGAQEATAPDGSAGSGDALAPAETTRPSVSAGTAGQGEATVPKETAGPGEAAAPDRAGESKEASVPKETSASKDAEGQKGTSGQEQAKAPEAPHEAEKAEAGSDTMKVQGGSAPALFTLDALNKNVEEKSTAVQMGGGKLLLTENMSVLAMVSAMENTPVPEKASAEGKAPASDKASEDSSLPKETQAPENTPKPGDASKPAQTTAPQKPQAQDEASKPAQTTAPQKPQAQDEASKPAQTTELQKPQAQDEASKPAQTTAPQKPQAQDEASKPAQTTAPQKPQAQDEASKPAQTTAPRTTQAQENSLLPVKTSAKQLEPKKASSSQADPDRQPVSFTRTVVVKAAVQYQNARFDVDTVTNLLTGMDFDQLHYSLSVLEDGGFNGSRINEYHVTYRLVNTDNGKKVADLERYIWITAPGIAFDAPDLELSLNQTGYDLQEGIDYNSSKYTLTTVNPESVDTSEAGEQRVMFHMTVLPGNAGIPEDADAPQGSPSQAEYSSSKEISGSGMEAGSGGPSPEEKPAVSGESDVRKAEGDSEVFPDPQTAEEAGAVSTKGTLARPVVAVFGRGVKVGEEAVVIIDAPPLVIQEGTAGEHDLLEGVTATDEDGNPVPLEVANRSELDRAVGRTPSHQEADEDDSVQETGAASLKKEPDLTGLTKLFSLLAIQKDSLMRIGDIPDLGKDMAGKNEDPSGSNEDGGAQSSAEPTDIPADLPPGTYEVLLAAVHPATGETFSMMRSVSVGLEEKPPLKILSATTELNPPYVIDVSKDHTPLFTSPGNITLTLTGVGYLDTFDITWIPPGSTKPITGNYSCITVAAGTNLTLILADGADVTLRARNGDDGGSGSKKAQGGGAGIFMQDYGGAVGTYLTILGNGKLTTIGGDAGAGGYAAGRLQGGGGGGGAGAGIGGIGGFGGIGGYPGHPDGANGTYGLASAPSHTTILAPNVTRINGSGNSLTPLVRDEGSASGGGGMAVDTASWDDGFSGSYGGGGGGAGGSATLRAYGGFGQGFGRFSEVNASASGDGGKGGTSSPQVRVALDARGNPRRLWFGTMGEAFAMIRQDEVKSIRNDYTVTLLGDYTYTDSDDRALQQLTGLGNEVKVKITGLDTPDRDPSQTKYTMSVSPYIIKFPLSDNASASAAFTMENLGLYAELTDTKWGSVYAGGSKLIMGPGIDMKNNGWAVNAGPLMDSGSEWHGDLTVYDAVNDDAYLAFRGAERPNAHAALTVAGKGVRSGWVTDWDTVNIPAGNALSVSEKLDLSSSVPTRVGTVKLDAGSKLSLLNSDAVHVNRAGSLETAGDGAVLEFARQSGAGSAAPLVLNGAAPMDLTAHPLKLSYTSSGAPVNGDKLIRFSPALTNARVEDYISGFGGDWTLKADQATGFVTLENRLVRLDYPASSGKASDFYGTLGRAMDALRADSPSGGKSGTYTLTMLENGAFTQDDQTAFVKATDLPQAVNVVITGYDAENPPVFHKQLTVAADMILPLGSAGVKGAAFELRDMELINGTVGWCIVANGSRLTLGDKIDMTGFEFRGGLPNVIGGSFERTDVAKDMTFTGNTWLEVRSGSWNNIVGGSWHSWTQTTLESDPAVSTVKGDTTVNVIGFTSAKMICGGSWVNTGSATYAASRRVGNSTVTLTGWDGGGAKVIAGGSGPGKRNMVEDSVTGTARVVLEGATLISAYGYPWMAGGNLSKQGNVELVVKGDVLLNSVAEFGTVHLTEDSKLEVMGFMYRSSSFKDDASRPAMLLDFQGGARLDLGSSGDVGGNKAGSFRIEGGGNALGLVQSSSGAASLTLDSAAPNVRVDNAQLILDYPKGAVVRPGEKLLSFNPAKQNADAADYVSNLGNLAIMADKRTGDVFAGSTVTVQEAGKGLWFYPSLAEAMNAVGNGTGEYTVTFRKEEYKLTGEDGIALATQGGKASKITYTSRFAITDKDVLEPGEKVGDTVTRTLVIGAGTNMDSPKSDLYLNSRISVVEKIRFKYLQAGCALYVNGHSLLIGPQVEILSDAGYYPVIYGGSKSQPVAGTDVTIQSGRYNGIYGGGREAGATVNGNSSVKFGGDAELVGSMYGGGEDGAVTGTATVEITGGKAMAADAASGIKNTVVGGGKTGDVGGVKVTISGGTANGTIEIAGCDGGNVLGDVNLYVKESPDSPPPKAALGNFYGSSLRQGTPLSGTAGRVTGNIQIIITNGKDYGTIRGGRSSITGAGKTSTITFKGGSVKVGNIMDFDFLNLGEPASSLDKTSLFLTGKLQGEEGCLEFWDGSVLTFQGTSMDPADLVVKNIQTDDTATRSHLHMYKGPGVGSLAGVTRPLNIIGENTSAPGNKLVLGEYGPGGTAEGDKIGKAGDPLLAFKTAGKADAQSYISDLQGLDVVPSKAVPGILELGLSASPKIALEGVRHTTQTGETTQADSPGAAVTKTLTFGIESFRDEDPTKPGGAVASAYVDAAWKPDASWAEGGAIPGGGQEIIVKQEAPGSVRWNGTVTMPVKPPVNPAPAYYFAHVRDENNQVHTAVLDVHSPVQLGDAAVSRDGGGSYTFTMNLQDLKPKDTGSSDIVYNVSGLKQVAWAVGKVGDPVPAGEAEALAPVMLQGGQLKQAVTLDTPSIDSYSWTFTVPAEVLGTDPADMAVYLYAKDALGNTGRYAIPLNNNRMDIQIPLWAGTVALRGGDGPHLLAPDLYVVNRSEKPVKAELVRVEIPENQGKPGDGKLLLTNKRSEPWAQNELNLMVKPVGDSPAKDYFAITSVKDINPFTNVLNLGIMSGRNEANHGVGFTFTALYDQANIIRTSGWSQCELTYRFSLAPPVRASAP